MSESRNIGILGLSFSLLERELLRLPEGHKIVAARMPNDFSETVDLLVEGPSLPLTPEGNLPQRVQFIFTSTETETLIRERNLEGKFLT